jgi:hypothetical protein
MPAKKEYWQINTERIADEIRAAASGAHTEEDLKMRVEPILRKSFKDIGIDIDIVASMRRHLLRVKVKPRSNSCNTYMRTRRLSAPWRGKAFLTDRTNDPERRNLQ